MSHRPRKRFGQNFLHDPAVIERILAAVDPQPGERLVEIGPGQGAITAGLLERAGLLDAIELDRDLAAALRERFAADAGFHLHEADALTFELCSLCSETERLRLVGNLPYNISTPLLFRFLEQAQCVGDMHFMLQHEVVERMAAPHGNRTYGRLSVMLQVSCRVTPLFDIGPGAFRPAPKVHSTFVRLQPYGVAPWPIRDSTLFSRLVAQAFGQRRKTLRNTLKGLVAPEDFARARVDPAERPEQLPPAAFVALANAACNHVKAP